MAQRYLVFVCSILLTLSLAACGDDDTGTPKTTDAGNNTATDAGTDADAETDAGTTPTCGDGVVEGDEVCDGDDLAGETCSTQGATSGVLACNDTCDGFDTTGCATCGNGTIDGNEECDGSALAGATCESQGADGGTLSCAANCTFDTSECFACGDGILNGDEECDGAQLGGQTCITQSFEGGTLGCTATCEFDVTACYICGDDLAEGPEVCDGTDLNGNTCATEGFVDGTLSCDQDCSLDNSLCNTCGDDTVNGGDICDGTDLAGETCASQGFDGGTLACEAACGAFDTSACYSCGDNTIGGPEVCDGTELGGATCASRGFDGGTLGCATTCDAFDESSCYACGDGAIEGPEVCDGNDLAGETCVSQGFDSGTLACDTSCGFDTTGCVDFPAPQVGEFYITEFMFDSSAIPDSDGEWIEFFNASSGTLALGDCEFRDSSNTYDVPAGTNVAPGAYFTIAASANPGFTPDLDDLSFGLNQSGDDIQVWCPNASGSLVLIDSVVYDGGPDFPDTPGASVAFDADLTGAVETLNDTGANWCEGRTAYGPGDLGTPGSANPGCAFCGNGIIDGTEVCDSDQLNGETCVSQGFDRGTLGCAAACDTYDTSQCENLPYPSVGDVVVNEVMVDPDAIDDSSGEYVELLSVSGNDLNLGGCEIRDSAANSFTIPVGRTIDAGTFFTLANSATPGFTPDIDNLTVSFNNPSDSAELWCPDSTGTQQLIDAVDFSQAGFPTATGASIQFDSDLTIDATNNDDGSNWCATSITTYGAGDLGTPGAANESCAIQTYNVGFCRLQFPTAINEQEGTVTTVYGRVYIAGLTDQSTANDTSPSVVAQLGYGPDASNPDGNSNWTWEDAIPNPAYDGSASGEPNNDEYQIDFSTPAAAGSPYDYAYRFSGDGGQTWLYCDSDGVSSDGSLSYDAAQAGDLVSTAPPAPTGLYFSEYAEGSSNNKAVEIFNSDTVDADLSNCSVNLYFNGSTSPSSIPLSGTLAAGDTYLVCNSSIDPSLLPAGVSCDTSGSLNFNGDDAVELVCADGPLDIIGEIGFDPGSAWSANGVSTQNATMRRACTVSAGDTDGTNAFDPSAEFTAASQDDFSDFGAYVCP